MNNLWLCDKVGSFWQGVNWENRVVADSTTSGDHYITVKQFFQSIPWSMMPVAAQYDQPPASSPEVTNDTLSDFLQDISKFF